MADPAPSTPNQLVINQIDTHPGVFLGEYHNQYEARQLLIDHMAEYKAHGVTTLYLELPEAEIAAIKKGEAAVEFYRSGEKTVRDAVARNGPPSGSYESEVNSLLSLQPVIAAAEKNGIRVAGYDTITYNEKLLGGRTNKALDSFDDYAERKDVLSSRDANAAYIVKETADGGKYIMLGGALHSRTADAVNLPNFASAGAPRLLGIPSIDFVPQPEFRNFNSELTHPVDPDDDSAVYGLQGRAILAPKNAVADFVVMHPDMPIPEIQAQPKITALSPFAFLGAEGISRKLQESGVTETTPYKGLGLTDVEIKGAIQAIRAEAQQQPKPGAAR